MTSEILRSELRDRAQVLFEPISINGLTLANRIAMAPMTRCCSPGGVPGADVAAYYKRRAEGGAGLIITESTWIPHPSASNDDNVPRFYGRDALAGWKRVADEVHAAGGRIFPQICHVGQTRTVELEGLYADKVDAGGPLMGPSGMVGRLGEMPTLDGEPATEEDIHGLIQAYGVAAHSVYELGFDGVEVHGAHGYLIDQFMWAITNLRSDRYGGSLSGRVRFACEVIASIRENTSRDFPIVMRLSQWKLHNYGARLVETPEEFEQLLGPMVDAGVDAFHCSQRRFWESEFGSSLNLAGWARKITGLPSIAVGSVGLENDFLDSLMGRESKAVDLSSLFKMIENKEFDMIAVGRAMLMNPDWAKRVQSGKIDELKSYDPEILSALT